MFGIDLAICDCGYKYINIAFPRARSRILDDAGEAVPVFSWLATTKETDHECAAPEPHAIHNGIPRSQIYRSLCYVPGNSAKFFRLSTGKTVLASQAAIIGWQETDRRIQDFSPWKRIRGVVRFKRKTIMSCETLLHRLGEKTVITVSLMIDELFGAFELGRDPHQMIAGE